MNQPVPIPTGPSEFSMSDLPAEPYLIGLMRRVEHKLDRLIDELHEIKVRVTAIDEALAGVNRRLDRIEARFETLERRMDLVEGR